MKLKDWMKTNRYRGSEMEALCGVDRTSIYFHCNSGKGFGKRRAERISKATNGEVTVIDLMFPELDVKILKKRDKNKDNDEKKSASESNETISHERTA